jgi:uncharacterized protein involved in outer membrane biogenesis
MNYSSWNVSRRIGAFLGAVLAGLSIVWLTVLAVGVSIPLDALRDSLESAASESLGREVRIGGSIALRPTLRPVIIVRGVRIGDPGDRGGADLLRAKRADASLGLTALLSGRLHIVRLRIQDVRIHLQTRTDGSRNWRPAEALAPAERAQAGVPPEGTTPVIRQRELEHVSLRNILLTYTDARTDRRYQFRFDELSGGALRERPLHLLLRGSVRQQAYVANLTGGTLSALLASAEPWPLHVATRFAEATLTLDGNLHAPLQASTLAMEFELQAAWSGDRERLPASEASVMRGRLAVSDAGLDLTELVASIGQTVLEGRVSARLDEEPPRITSELRVSELDAAPLFAAVTGPDTGESSLQRRAGELQPQGPAPVPDWLEAVAVDAGIRIRKILHVPIPIRDAELTLSVRDGQLTAPLSLKIAEVPFRGKLVLARQNEGPELTLALTARNARAERLTESLTGSQGIRGVIGRLEFQAAAGRNGAPDFLNGLAMDLNLTGAALSYGHVPGGRPVDLNLEALALTVPAGKELSGTAKGTLRGAPFAVEFTGARLESFFSAEASPVALSARGAGAKLNVNSRLANPRTRTESRLNLDVTGKRLGDLAGWFGVSPCAEASYTARAQLVFAGPVGRVQSLEVHTGRTRLNGKLDWSGDAQGTPPQASVHFDELDPADLGAFVPLFRPREADVNESGVTIDMPVLPRPVEIHDADIRLGIARILLKPVDITDVSLFGRLRAGSLQRSPFHAGIGTTGFHGYLEPSGAVTDVVFEVDEHDSDSGNRLHELFSSAVEWAGSVAIVPLQWLFEHKLSGDGRDVCTDAKGGAPEHR